MQRTIYLTIMSASQAEEACHRLMRLSLPQGKGEEEFVSMIIEMASQERTFSRYYGLIGEILSRINGLWKELFEASFIQRYETIHRYETVSLSSLNLEDSC